MEGIPKIIHYCWFGEEKIPNQYQKYIKTWEKTFPEYRICKWDEKNFPMEKYKYAMEALKSGKMAFVSDVARMYALYEYGGIYLDTDMEIIKDITPLLNTKLFLGYENDYTMSFGIVGTVAKNDIFKKFIEFYEEEIWHSPLHIVTGIFTKILTEKYGDIFNISKEEVIVYPREYFYPYNHDEEFTEECITPNTYAIHWWGKSWGKNPKVYFLKYKHLPWWKKYPKHMCKLINYYFKVYMRKVK